MIGELLWVLSGSGVGVMFAIGVMLVVLAIRVRRQT